ncbi:6440_t:CDS:2, partial [Dentiscutata heterogama]
VLKNSGTCDEIFDDRQWIFSNYYYRKFFAGIDGALAIPFNPDNIKTFGNIEEKILSRTRPKQWGKIELGRICYQISSTSKADHYDLKSDVAIMAFVAEIKCKKNLQLCVYQEPKNKNTHNRLNEDEESNQLNKRIRTLETDSNTLNTLNTIKKNIYNNLLACSIHIQGCLISEDGADERTPPNSPLFDKSKYRYPTSNHPLKNVITLPILPIEITSILRSVTVHTKKKSLFKANIHITKDMTFQDLLTFIFPSGPPNGKRFVIKSSLELDGKSFLPDQIMSQIFVEEHAHIWIEIEDTEIRFDDLFD